MNRSINKLPQCSALLQPHKTSEHKTEVTLCLFERRLEYNTNSAQILWQKKKPPSVKFQIIKDGSGLIQST